MKKVLEIALGIVTSIGGFLEIGSIVTAAQAGAEYRAELIWAIALGGICVMFLVEMSGRFAAVSKHTITDALRERFGAIFFLICSAPLVMIMFLVLVAEIGGVCIALELSTGVSFQWWAFPVMLGIWLLLWKGSFALIEKGVSLLGLVTVCFLIGWIKSKPDWHQVTRGLIPQLPSHDGPRYWFLAVSIIGASVSPYLMYFYSSGAIEDEWDEKYLTTNRIVAGGGMGFGTVISIAVLGLAAIYFYPRGIKVDHYSPLPLMLTPIFGFGGFILFVCSLGIACLGAALEISLEIAYFIAQGLGWNWGKNMRPREEARFTVTYTIAIVLAGLVACCGLDPLKLTVLSMALTAATLPIAITPFLILMNDEHYMKGHRNRWFSNLIVITISILACILAVMTIPLEILGG
jgi:Mn2+/Fe2+ NRAMP family transporter